MTYLDSEENGHRHISKLVAEYEDALSKNKQYFFDQDKIEQVIEFYEAQRAYDQALEAVNISLVQFPYSSFLLVKKAQLLFELKMCSKALKYLEKAEIYDPSDSAIHFLRAEIYAYQKHFEKAIAILNEMKQDVDKEEYVDLLLQMADVYEDWENFDQLFETLAECIETEVESEEALNRINYITEITGNFERSINLHQRILEEHPFNVLAWYNISSAYSGMGLTEKAIDALEYTVALDPELDFAYRDLANLRMDIGLYDKALDAIEEFKELVGENEDSWLVEGRCMHDLKEYNEARKIYQKAIDKWQNNAFFHSLVAETYAAEGNWSLAKKSYQKAANSDNQNYEYWLSLAWTAFEDEDYETVEVAVNQCLEIEAERFDAYYLNAQTKFNCELFEQARSILDTGISANNNAIELIYAKAALLITMGKRKQGIELLQVAVASDKTKYTAFFTFAPRLEDDSTLLDIIDQKKD